MMSSSDRFTLSRRDGEVMRVLASVSVVIAHCVHFWVEGFSSTASARPHLELFSLGTLASILDQFTRFTVPFFLFLSGLGLTLQFLKKPPQWKAYYRFRMTKILIPFFVWTFLTSFRHLDYFMNFPWEQVPMASLMRLLHFMLFDGFDYQYYFLIVIFQFYLLFPLLYKLMQPPRTGWVLGFVLLVQLAITTPGDGILGWLGLEIPLLHPNLFIYYAFYCLAGMYAAWHRDFLAKLVQRLSTAQIVSIWAFSFFLLLLEYWLNIFAGKGLMNSDHFNRWSVVLYCLASLLLILKNKNLLEKTQNNPVWSFIYTGVAPYTFFVYLFHTHLLRAVDYLCWEVTLGDFLGRILWVVGGSYAFAWLSQWLLEDFPRLRLAFGLPKASLRKEDLPGLVYALLKFNKIKGYKLELPHRTEENSGIQVVE